MLSELLHIPSTMLDRGKILRWGQVGVNVVIIILSMCVCLPLGYVWKYFRSTCVLHANVYTQVSLNKTVQVLADKTVWGDSTLCMYTIFLPVVVAIHAFIWTWFFICLRIALKEDGRDNYLALPVVFLHTVLVVCMVVSSSIVSTGFSAWCHSLTHNIQPAPNRYTCADLQDLDWALFRRKRNIYTFLQVGEVCSWLLSVVLLSQVVLTLFKCYYDWSREGGIFYTEKDSKETQKAGHSGPYSETGSLISDTSGHMTSSVDENSSNSSRRSSKINQVI